MRLPKITGPITMRSGLRTLAMKRQIGAIFCRVWCDWAPNDTRIEVPKSLPTLAMQRDTGERKFRRAPMAETAKSREGIVGVKSPQHRRVMRVSTAETS